MERTNYSSGAKWEEYGLLHHEAFSIVNPCTSMIEVAALTAPSFLIEIEATAILNS